VCSTSSSQRARCAPSPCSNITAVQIVEAQEVSRAAGLSRFTVCQDHYNLLTRGIEAELIPVMEAHKLALIPYFPLAGGFTPYQAARWEHGWVVRPEPKKNVPQQPRNIIDQLYYDTILHSDRTLEALIHLASASRVLVGSDYPYDMAMMGCVTHVQSLLIPEADKSAILGGHAETLLSGVSA
jgi:hypothetical protein